VDHVTGFVQNWVHLVGAIHVPTGFRASVGPATCTCGSVKVLDDKAVVNAFNGASRRDAQPDA
jgi:hypothetical protein